MNNPKIKDYEWRYDPEAKAGYFKLSSNPVLHTTILVEGSVMLDKDKDGNVVGIEIVL